MRRVVVVGTTGAGKTTFGRALARELEAVFIELDALHWQSGWTPAPNFTAQVEQVLQTECWVADGNYNDQVQPYILARADTLIWLDYSFGTKLWRLFRRTCRRAFGGETLWNGNTENVRKAFFSRQSIFLWFFQTHWSQRRRYERLLSELPGPLTVYRLYRPAEASEFLTAVTRR